MYLKIFSVGDFDSFLDNDDSAFLRNWYFNILVIATLPEKYSNTEFFLVRIQPKYGKIRTSKNSVFGHFYGVQLIVLRSRLLQSFSRSYMSDRVLSTPPYHAQTWDIYVMTKNYC